MPVPKSSDPPHRLELFHLEKRKLVRHPVAGFGMHFEETFPRIRVGLRDLPELAGENEASSVHNAAIGVLNSVKVAVGDGSGWVRACVDGVETRVYDEYEGSAGSRAGRCHKLERVEGVAFLRGSGRMSSEQQTTRPRNSTVRIPRTIQLVATFIDRREFTHR
jgi:hypothetical protein